MHRFGPACPRPFAFGLTLSIAQLWQVWGGIIYVGSCALGCPVACAVVLMAWVPFGGAGSCGTWLHAVDEGEPEGRHQLG
eukprot:1949385-Amphidinium_carterae.1